MENHKEKEKINERSWIRAGYVLGITLVVLLAFRYVIPLVIPFIFAMILAKILHPLAAKITQKTRIPKGLVGVTLVMISLLLVVGVVYWGIYQLYDQCRSLAQMLPHWKEAADELICDGCRQIEQIGGGGIVAALEESMGKADSWVAQAQKKVVPYLMNLSLDSAKWMTGILWQILVFVVAAVMLLSDYENVYHWVSRNSIGKKILQLLRDVLEGLWAYLKAQFWIMLMVIGICILGLWLAKNPYAFLLGILIGITDALPFLGTGLVFIPWLIWELIQGEYGLAILYGAIYLLCTVVREVMEPHLVGKETGLHPLAVIFSIYVGMELYGVPGVVYGPIIVLIVKKWVGL